MPENDLDLLTAAAREAGDLALEFFHGHAEVYEKEDKSPVTEADLAVDKLLKERLLTARPDYGWLSEETPDDNHRLETERQFIVDPIDGTRSFVAGQSSWGIALAVVDRGEVSAAAFLMPAKDRIYTASKGAGAFVNTTPMSVAKPRQLEGAGVLTTRANLHPDNWARDVPAIEMAFRPSLVYRIALVAEGRFDATVTFRDCWEWDVAAGALLVTEAGGRVSGRSGAAPSFNSPTGRTDGLIAAEPLLHGQIIGRAAAAQGGSSS